MKMRKAHYHTQQGNTHLDKLTEFFGGFGEGSLILPESTAFVFICYTNRCGSNYLADLLSSTGTYNLAGEDLNWDTVLNNSKKHNLNSFHEYFSFLVHRLARSNRVFIKLAIPHIELLGRSGILDQIIGRSFFILIERNDKLSQAISFAIAFGTGRYTSWMDGTKNPQDVPFSQSQLDNILTGIAEQYRQFDLFFARNGLIPFHLSYEQLVADPAIQLPALARYLDVEALTIKSDALKLKRQASAVNDEWRSKYLKASSVY